MNRTKTLSAALAWAQPDLAAFLGVSQSTVSRLALGGRETGPVARQLDQLQGGLASGVVVAGMTPAAAQEALLAAVSRGNAA